MQQATVNLLSDMGAQPGMLQAGLVPGGPLDTSAPTTVITDPTDGATIPGGNVTIAGTAADAGGGIVAAVEVSTDGGTTWARAIGTTSWTYAFNASNGTFTVKARAIDDSANIGAPSQHHLHHRCGDLPMLDLRVGGDRSAGERHQRPSSSASSSEPTWRDSSPASGSTRPRATRAATPAPSGRRPGRTSGPSRSPANPPPAGRRPPSPRPSRSTPT